MQLIITESTNDFHREAAAIVSRQVMQKPDSLLGLATGDTTVGIYEWMIRYHQELGIDYSQCKTCNLDEYVGVAAEDPRSCCYRINEGLLDHINIKKENTYVPSGIYDPPEKELAVFEETIERFGGIDLMVLGIGQNGHIAFNEPGSSFDSTFSLVPISQSTIKAKAGLFGGEDKVPHLGISMGIRDIMKSRVILMVASGISKREVTEKILNGPVTEDVPASVVKLHPHVMFLVDRAALG